MIDIHQIMDEMSSLEREINDKAKGARQSIVESLLSRIRRNDDDTLDIDGLISDAIKLARFVEYGDERSDYEKIVEFGNRPSLGKRLIKAAKEGRAIVNKPKRKYTKRSKRWAKKRKTSS